MTARESFPAPVENASNGGLNGGAGIRTQTAFPAHRAESIELPAIAGQDGEYVLRMRGDSMTDAGILNDDHLVVKTADTALDGDIVVALVGGDATVKRWRLGPDGTPWLEPANPLMEPVRGVRVRVVGLVVGLFRSVSSPASGKQRPRTTGERA
jgi:SOS-response transcriptional repressor LexA